MKRSITNENDLFYQHQFKQTINEIIRQHCHLYSFARRKNNIFHFNKNKWGMKNAINATDFRERKKKVRSINYWVTKKRARDFSIFAFIETEHSTFRIPEKIPIVHIKNCYAFQMHKNQFALRTSTNKTSTKDDFRITIIKLFVLCPRQYVHNW